MIDPIAFQLGPIAIHWYGILIGGAFLIGILGSAAAVNKAGLDEEAFYAIAMGCVFAAILGARLYYVIFQWDYYSAHLGEVIAIWHGGLAIHGGVIGGLVALWLGSRYYKISFWHLADIIGPFLILGQAIGRWGNYFNQEAYGYEVDPAAVPWAMFIDGAYRHPTFLYESLWNLLVFALLLILARQTWIRRGEVALSYFILYSAGRVVIEGFRTDSLMLGPLRMAQVISLVMIATALLLIVLRHKNAPLIQPAAKSKDGTKS